MRALTRLILIFSVASCSGKTDITGPPTFKNDLETWDTFGGGTIAVPGEAATLRILTPQPGDVVEGPDITVTWEVVGCDIGGPSSVPEGCHLHRVLDEQALPEDNGGPWGHYENRPFQISALDAGSHQVQIILIPNDKPGGFDDSPHDNPIFATVDFEVTLAGDTGPTVDTGGLVDTGDSTLADTGATDTGSSALDTSDTGMVVVTDTANAPDTSDTGLDTIDDDGDGFSEADGDCEDGNPLINPGATDLPGDGLDLDCDGIDG
jgi:hypothetical protein